MKVPIAGPALAACLVMPFALHAQHPDTAAAAPPVTITGSVTTSYAWSSHPMGDSIIVGRLFDRHHNSFSLSVLDLALDRAAPTDRVAAGFHAEGLIGQAAELAKSVGLDLGRDADIWQAYAILNVPLSGAGRYVQLKGGKMATLLGVEVGEDVQNANFSVGYQDIFLEPYTETGAELDVKLDPRWDAELRVSNGWDQVTDVNQGKTVTGRLGITPDNKTLLAIAGYIGPEQAGNNTNERAGADVVASRRLTPATTAVVQLDYGVEAHAAAGARQAQWSGAGMWLTYDVAPAATLALRGDYMNDRDGARTSGVLGFPRNDGIRVGDLTATLNVKRWVHALLRPEIRFDRATLPVFDGHESQISVAMALSYIF
ncbi:MAG TPA: outer membrane beta-barrel protein [Gemmatimonadaceae bacterium]|nr:outer membrane beta-barrel protein [Gemmatimonadaceae bacterium]